MITGNRIGGRNELRFNAASGIPAVAGGKKEATLELHFPETNDAEWRYGPSATLIRAVGCHAFRIEGEDFVEWVTFIARNDLPFMARINESSLTSMVNRRALPPARSRNGGRR